MTKRLLADYIKVYRDALPPRECQALIDRFEGSTAQHQARVSEDYSFVELDVTQHWPDQAETLLRMFYSCYNQYHTTLGVRRFWPNTFRFENLRLKRYLPGGRDHFAPHVDVITHPDAARFVTAILYLNQPPQGGETVFEDLGIVLPPEPGKIIVFPPLWTFAHAGRPPVGAPKYILHSYLWYPEQ